MSSTSKRISRVYSRCKPKEKHAMKIYEIESGYYFIYRGRYDIAKTKVKRLLDLEGEPDLPLEKSNTPRVDRTKVPQFARAVWIHVEQSAPSGIFLLLPRRPCLSGLYSTHYDDNTHKKRERMDHFPVCKKKKEKKQNSCYCSLVMVIRERRNISKTCAHSLTKFRADFVLRGRGNKK